MNHLTILVCVFAYLKCALLLYVCEMHIVGHHLKL